ncbi:MULTISPECIES: hypothetical protein [unclassified Streptomyces]|uniref:hypothetical protein n=1 Tax=unclassified Streptomyces TaxID=2593676 RepID=UPI002259E708|nr:hypothetical protein [Streptomyces sp. NBC_00047]MCX5608500.1 hypothetical protein [Streptomyces sp. NBC_00047]
MNAEEARQLETTLRRLGIPGVVAPEDPENPAGNWLVFDEADPETRRDVTADTLAALSPACGTHQGPTRGFIISRTS